MVPLKTQAIQTALQGDWNAAVTLNQMLLEEDPNDIDAMNRLAFAKAALGNTKEAKNIYQKVLVLDVTNTIAIKNIQRLSGNSIAPTNGPMQVNNVFIEEPGKTKVIELLNIADKKVVSVLRNGEHLTLAVKRMKIFVHDLQKQYIGMLPDDIGNRLIKFIDGGNQYEAYVKMATSSKVTVLIKEVKRAQKFINQPSFISIDKTKFVLEKNCRSIDDIFLIAADAGAEDVEDAGEEVVVYTRPEDLAKVRDGLLEAGEVVKQMEIIRQPITVTAIADVEAAKKATAFIEKLEEMDDVQKVYVNFDIPEDIALSLYTL